MQIIQGTIYRILELISRNKRFSLFRITRLTICIMVLVLFASSSDAITRFDALAAIPGRQSQLQTPHPPSEDITVFLPLLFKPASDLKGRVKEHTVTLPHSLGTNVYNWCTWGSCQISPRLYHAPMNGGGTLVGWMDSSGNGHISVIDASGSLGDTYDYSNKSISWASRPPGWNFCDPFVEPEHQGHEAYQAQCRRQLSLVYQYRS